MHSVHISTRQSERIVGRKNISKEPCSASGHLDWLLPADAHEAAAFGDGGFGLGDLLNHDRSLGGFGLLGGSDLPGLWFTQPRLWCIERGLDGANRACRRDGFETLRKGRRGGYGCLLTSAGVRLGTTVEMGSC